MITTHKVLYMLINVKNFPEKKKNEREREKEHGITATLSKRQNLRRFLKITKRMDKLHKYLLILSLQVLH